MLLHGARDGVPLPIGVIGAPPHDLLCDIPFLQCTEAPRLQPHGLGHVHQTQEQELLRHVLEVLWEGPLRVIDDDGAVRTTARLPRCGMVEVRVIPVRAAHVVRWKLELVPLFLPRTHVPQDVVPIALGRHVQAVRVQVRMVQRADRVWVEEEAEVSVPHVAALVARAGAQVIHQLDPQLFPGFDTDGWPWDRSVAARPEVAPDPGHGELHCLQVQGHGAPEHLGLDELLVLHCVCLVPGLLELQV
mmetsp:Transcript_91711/g.231376  ORF Transcript_91711/g.231376 Transcript_91711/m.231376 type:complete len:246 (-) Transcript_91711:341-1078(-)